LIIIFRGVGFFEIKDFQKISVVSGDLFAVVDDIVFKSKSLYTVGYHKYIININMVTSVRKGVTVLGDPAGLDTYHGARRVPLIIEEK